MEFDTKRENRLNFAQMYTTFKKPLNDRRFQTDTDGVHLSTQSKRHTRLKLWAFNPANSMQQSTQRRNNTRTHVHTNMYVYS